MKWLLSDNGEFLIKINNINYFDITDWPADDLMPTETWKYFLNVKLLSGGSVTIFSSENKEEVLAKMRYYNESKIHI